MSCLPVTCCVGFCSKGSYTLFCLFVFSFGILGTTYGGDGRITFALPNLSGLKTKDEKGKVDCFIAVVGIFPSRSEGRLNHNQIYFVKALDKKLK